MTSDPALHLEIHESLGTALQVGRLVVRLPAPFPDHPPSWPARGEELAFLWRAVSEPEPPPGVVLSGPPGSGKSTLALRWAYQACDLFPGGLHYRDARAPGPAEPLADALRSLLIIDNAADEPEVRPLLPVSEASFAVVTTRNPLPGLVIDGFRPLHVPPPTGPSTALPFPLPELPSVADSLPPDVLAALLHTAQAEAEETGDQATHAAVSLRLARLHLDASRRARALHCYARALEAYARLGDTASYARVLREITHLPLNP